MSHEESPPTTARQLLQLLQSRALKKQLSKEGGRRKSRPRASPAIGANGKRLCTSEFFLRPGYGSEIDEDLPIDAISPPWPVRWVPGLDYGSLNLAQGAHQLLSDPTNPNMTLEPHSAHIAPGAPISISINNPFPVISMRDPPPAHLLSSILPHGHAASALHLPYSNIFTDYLPTSSDVELGDTSELLREMAQDAGQLVDNFGLYEYPTPRDLLPPVPVDSARMNIDPSPSNGVIDTHRSDAEPERQHRDSDRVSTLVHPAPITPYPSNALLLQTSAQSTPPVSSPVSTTPNAVLKSSKVFVIKRASPMPTLPLPTQDIPSSDTTIPTPHAPSTPTSVPVIELIEPPVALSSSAPDSATPSEKVPLNANKKRSRAQIRTVSDESGDSETEQDRPPTKKRVLADPLEWTAEETEFLRTHCDPNADRQKWGEICKLMNQEIGSNKNSTQCSKHWYRMRNPVIPNKSPSKSSTSKRRVRSKNDEDSDYEDAPERPASTASTRLSSDKIDTKSTPQPVHTDSMELGSDQDEPKAVPKPKAKTRAGARTTPSKRRPVDSDEEPELGQPPDKSKRRRRIPQDEDWEYQPSTHLARRTQNQAGNDATPASIAKTRPSRTSASFRRSHAEVSSEPSESSDDDSSSDGGSDSGSALS